MKVTLLSLIVAVVFSGILPLYLSAQEGATGLQTPSTASITANSAERLVPGQEFTFQLQFDKAPEGYGGGEIDYAFKNIDPAHPTYSSGVEQIDYGNKFELHDGQAIYSASVPINYTMAPGVWKLVAIRLGKNVLTSIKIPGNVTFDIQTPDPVAVRIQAPDFVRAGQEFVFAATLEKFPRVLQPGCHLTISGDLAKTPNDQPLGRPFYEVRANSFTLSSDQRSYKFVGRFDADLPIGDWVGGVIISATENSTSVPRFSCRTPPIEGETKFSFTVGRALGLVTPTSVTVKINPSQIELLRGEADRLRAKADHLKEYLNAGTESANQALLVDSVKEALAEIDSTEAQFKKKSEGPVAPAVNEFFDDIRVTYGEALKALPNESSHLERTPPRFERVRAVANSSTMHLTRASEAVIGSIAYNAKAYDVAVSSKTMTFNLWVYSKPQGATISYRRRTEDYQSVDHETDWEIENIAKGHYFIRLQKPGYEDKVVEFDAINDLRTSINPTLVRIHGAR